MNNEITIKKLGLGTAQLVNMFREVPEDEAMETIQTAWNEGIRYFYTALFYGARFKIRLGEILPSYKRDEYLLSSKVGRIVLDEEEKRRGV